MASPVYNVNNSYLPQMDETNAYLQHQHTSPDASMQLSPTFQTPLDDFSPGAWTEQDLVQGATSPSLAEMVAPAAANRTKSSIVPTSAPKSKPPSKSRAKPRTKKDNTTGKASTSSTAGSTASQGASPQSQAELTKMFLADLGKTGAGTTPKTARQKSTSSISAKDGVNPSGSTTQRKRKRPTSKKRADKTSLAETLSLKAPGAAHKLTPLSSKIVFPDGGSSDLHSTRAPSRPQTAKSGNVATPKATSSTTSPLPPQDARFKYQEELRAIMFIQGHRQRDRDTVELLEDLVRQHLLSVAVLAAANTRLRGARNMTTDDLLFVCRRNKVLAARLAEFVAQKDSRKRNWHAGLETRGSARFRSKWLILTSLNEMTSECEVLSPSQSFSDCVDEYAARSDVVAQGLAPQEQKQLSDAKRTMSFTLKKTKRFREWLNLGSLMEFKANDDFYETMGHLAWMISVEILEVAERVMNPTAMVLQPAHLHEGIRRMGSRAASIL
eukprot:m.1284597 g.1284597  ORF g.1284597 m.1284597 type:complete len:497 (+) comp24778_c0_seq42:308-1798(+)